jgi:hypothetical protein
MDFTNLTLQEMLAFNRQLCEAITQRRAADSAVKITQLALGDKVKYPGSKKSAPFIATVTKVLRTNVDVVTAEGKAWRIPAAMLTKV